MPSITITLVAEGSADRALIPVIQWLAEDANISAKVTYPSLGWNQEKLSSMADKITTAIRMEQCNILCIHRDANGAGINARKQEILSAVNEAKRKAGPRAFQFPMGVCVIPVRETEAWFLIDKDAICQAAAAPKGTSVQLPTVGNIENILQPKEHLHEMLKKASGASGRRLKKFRPQERVHRIAELIGDYSPLRALSAFQEFEKDFRAACEKLKDTN